MCEKIDWATLKHEGYLSPRGISVRLERLARQMAMTACELTEIQLSIEKFYIGADEEEC